MSISDLISGLLTARNTIRDKFVDLGIANSTAKLDDLATAASNIVNRGGVTATVKEGETYTIAAGYHDGSGTVSGVSGGGSYLLQSKQVTPTKTQQSIVSDDGYYGLSDVVVAAIPDAYQNVSSVTAEAADVLAGKVIVDATGTKTGTMADNGTIITQTLDATTGKQSYTIPAGKHSGSGKVQIVLEEKSVTPSDTTQEITPTSGKVLSNVTVEKIPDKYGDTTGDTGVAANILTGIKVHTISDNKAVQITGTMADNGGVTGSIDGLTSTSFSIPAGYTSGGTVSLTNDIETALAAI